MFLSRSEHRPLAVLVASTLMLAVLSNLRAEPSAKDKAAAQEAFAAGMELREHGNAKAALPKFRRAYDLLPSPITAFELGRAYAAVGLLLEAHERLREAATWPVKEGESATAKDARDSARELASEVKERTPTIQIKISGAPADAKVTLRVDGKVVALTSEPKPFNPGKHRVEATSDDRSDSKEIDLPERDAANVTLKLGDSGGDAPRERAGGGGGTSAWTWIGFTTAGVGLIGGAVFGGIALSQKSNLGCANGVCTGTTVQSDIDGMNLMAHLSTGAFILAGVGTGIGVIALVTTGGGSDGKKKSGGSVELSVGWSSVGLRGSF